MKNSFHVYRLPSILQLLLIGGTSAFLNVHQPLSTSSSSSSSNWITPFRPTTNTPPSRTTTTTLPAALTVEQITSRIVTYSTSVPRPMGIIFGENPDPYYGLVVDDVAEGMNGGRAGLKMGDQVISVNGNVVLGNDFDAVMGLLTDATTYPILNLVMFRGSVRDLYTILGNQLEDGESIQGDDDEYDEYDPDSEDDDEEIIIMDENYESPVRIEVKEEKPLTAADFVKAIGKLGSMVAETITAPVVDESSSSSSSSAENVPKKKTGFFGFGAEAIQLDGDDAVGYKREKPKPDKF
jgi:hypothetical protein